MESFIPAAWYYPIFMTFITILVIVKILPVSNKNILTCESSNIGNFKVWVIGIFLILFFGLRDPIDPKGYFADTAGYAAFFEMVKEGRLSSSISELLNGTLDTSQEVGFRLIRDFIADLQLDVSLWFIVVAAIYIVPVIIAVHKMFPGHEYLAFLFWLCSFGFYGGAVNGLRNADATSIFFLGFTLVVIHLARFNIRKLPVLIGFILCFISYFFHHSIIILWVSFILSLFIVKNTNTAIIIWIASILLSLMFGNSLANMTLSWELDDRAEGYLAGGSNIQEMAESFSHVGFRWDFLLFSAVPIVWGYYITNVKHIRDRTFQVLLNTYIIANAIWIIFMYAAYTNRFAALSWSLYPFVISYPLIKFRVYPNMQSFVTGLYLILILSFNLIF